MPIGDIVVGEKDGAHARLEVRVRDLDAGDRLRFRRKRGPDAEPPERGGSTLEP